MEYDLWVEPSLDYYNQIIYDINFYLTSWNVNPNKIILGLMPGKDDSQKNLTLQNALNLTTFAKSKNLQGIMGYWKWNFAFINSFTSGSRKTTRIFQGS